MRALIFAALLVPSALEATTWVYHSPAAAYIHDRDEPRVVPQLESWTDVVSGRPS
jgi:hypothetical protein